MFTPKGKFGWYEFMTSDTKAAGKFYSNVVGWTTREVASGNSDQYTTFNLGDIGIAGMLHLPAHTGWIGLEHELGSLRLGIQATAPIHRAR